MQQRRNAATVSQVMAQILEIKEQSEFLEYSMILNQGAALERPTFLIKTSTILSSRTLTRCDFGLPRNTLSFTGTTGHVFERPPTQEGQSFTIFKNSKNLASSSQELGHDITETARREMKRESLNTPTQSPHFQSRSGMLNHTGGTYSTEFQK